MFCFNNATLLIQTPPTLFPVSRRGAREGSWDTPLIQTLSMDPGVSLLMRFVPISFQVGFGINLNNVGNPDSAFPSAVYKTLEGMQANFQNPFWRFQISTFPFQNSVIDAIKYLRLFAKNVIEERCLALQNRDETPSDILEHIVKEAQEKPEINMDDLVDNFLTVFIAGMNI